MRVTVNESVMVIGLPLVGVNVMEKSTVAVGVPRAAPDAVSVNPVQSSVAVIVPSSLAAAGKLASRTNSATTPRNLKRDVIDCSPKCWDSSWIV